METRLHRASTPANALLPHPIWTAARAVATAIITSARAVATAIITPIVFSLSTGHFRSSLLAKSVTKAGAPLPWYSYPCIDLLRHRSYRGKTVLEFGGGQSTLWWGQRADRVVTFESDPQVYADFSDRISNKIAMYLIEADDKESYLDQVNERLSYERAFDIVAIDGGFRSELVTVALNSLAPDGAVICDNSEGYGFLEATKNLDLQRVDFFGHAPGVLLPHCTSIYFRDKCFLFNPSHPVPSVHAH
jgi:hypothetical protein